MAAMIQNDTAKAWMQPIMDFRDKFLAVEDRQFRDFRRMDNRLILLREQLVHGPYSQERRHELLCALLNTQEQVKASGKSQGFDRVDLISLDELEEIRRIWVEQKGEIEDSLPSIYEMVTGRSYPGKPLDPMPLDASDLMLLREVVSEWVSDQLSSADPKVHSERRDELYKLVRTLLATSFKGLQSRNRSKQLDELGALLKAFAFVDEADGLAFALQYLATAPNERADFEVPSELETLRAEMDSDDSGTTPKRVIPITPEDQLLI